MMTPLDPSSQPSIPFLPSPLSRVQNLCPCFHSILALLTDLWEGLTHGDSLLLVDDKSDEWSCRRQRKQLGDAGNGAEWVLSD